MAARARPGELQGKRLARRCQKEGEIEPRKNGQFHQDKYEKIGIYVGF